MKAYVLIKIRAGEIPEVVRNLRRLAGVEEADMTFGPYDAVARVRAADLDRLGRLVALDIQPIPGVVDTLTCMAVEVEGAA